MVGRQVIRDIPSTYEDDEMLNLNDLQIFVWVVDHGGFTAASRALRIPKQTLSKRVAELERRAGVRLIQRTSRSFAVTDLGRELHRHAAAMMIEAEAAENAMLGRLAEPSGIVRITASVPTVQTKLAGLLPRIAATYPKVRVVLHASDRFVDIVQEGFDIALRTHSAPLPNSDLVQRRVETDEFWLVASPTYLAGRTSREPGSIHGLDGIFAVEGKAIWELKNGDRASCSATLVSRYVANEEAAILAAARSGLGIASLPSTMCRNDIRAGRLIRVCDGWVAGEITTTMLFPHRRGLLPSVRVVADMLVEALADQD